MIFDDFYNLQMYRQDGRKQNQMRSVEIQMGVSRNVPNFTNQNTVDQKQSIDILSVLQNEYDGMSHIKTGLSEVLCFINGPSTSHKKDKIIQINYSQACFSGINRKQVSKYDKEWEDLAESLSIMFEKLIVRENYKNQLIGVHLCILQDDGSLMSAAINAISLGLIDCGVQMKDMMVASTVGMLKGEVVCDLTVQEEKDCEGILTISYWPNDHEIDYLELHSAKLKQKQVSSMVETGIQRCLEMHTIMKRNVVEYSIKKIILQQ